MDSITYGICLICQDKTSLSVEKATAEYFLLFAKIILESQPEKVARKNQREWSREAMGVVMMPMI